MLFRTVLSDFDYATIINQSGKLAGMQDDASQSSKQDMDTLIATF